MTAIVAGTKIRQLTQMLEECDANAVSLSKGYESCIAALRTDFDKTLEGKRSDVRSVHFCARIVLLLLSYHSTSSCVAVSMLRLDSLRCCPKM